MSVQFHIDVDGQNPVTDDDEQTAFMKVDSDPIDSAGDIRFGLLQVYIVSGSKTAEIWIKPTDLEAWARAVAATIEQRRIADLE